MLFKRALVSVQSAALVAALLSPVGLLAPTQAEAGSGSQGGSCASLGARALGTGADLTITIATGDTVTMVVTGGTANAPARYSVRSGLLSAPITLNATGSTVYVAQKGDTEIFIEAQSQTLSVTCAPAGSGASTDTSASSDTSASTDTSATEQAAEQTSLIGGNLQNQSIASGVASNAHRRFNGGGNAVNQNAIFLSTQNIPGGPDQFENPGWNAWISGEVRSLSGNTDGDSYDVVVGVDRFVTPDLIIGGLLGANRTDVAIGTIESESTSIAVGAYFAQQLQNGLFLDGSLSYAEPDYDIDGASFKSKRTGVSLNLSGSYMLNETQVVPYAALTAFDEALPAYTVANGRVAANDVTSTNLQLGAQFNFQTTSVFRPYVSIAADYGTTNSTLTGYSDFVSPRYGTGFAMDLGNGLLSIDVDGGSVADGVDDLGFLFRYDFEF